MRPKHGRHRRPLRRRWDGEEREAGEEGDEERAAMVGWRSGPSKAEMRRLLFDIVAWVVGFCAVRRLLDRSFRYQPCTGFGPTHPRTHTHTPEPHEGGRTAHTG